MFDAQAISQVIGRKQYEAINASTLPREEAMTLLQIWTQRSPKRLRELAQAGDLLPILDGFSLGLEVARDTRLNNSHLTMVECLQVAELPLAI